MIKNYRLKLNMEKLYVFFQTLRFNVTSHNIGISKNLMERNTWGALVGNYYLLNHKLRNQERYREMVKQIFSQNEDRLKDKEMIKICIILVNMLYWPGDDLYQLFKKDSRVDLIVCYPIKKGEELLYEDTIHYLENKQIPYLTSDDKDKWIDSDIFIGATDFPPQNDASIYRRKLTSLSVEIPYTFWHHAGGDHSYYGPRSGSVWKLFLPTEVHREEGARKTVIGDCNMFFSGYPKLDAMLCFPKGDAWSFAQSDTKRILYTPGFPNREFGSTFMDNYLAVLDIAKKNNKHTSWIYRAHPFMRKVLADNGMMEPEDYDMYLNEWEKLPNAMISYGGDYYDMFLTSDAMITDSISFVSGYQYTKKPLLVLENRKKDVLNHYGELLMQVQERAYGDDSNAISDFVDGVVSGTKKVKQERIAFFEQFLNYREITGLRASEYIYKNIMSSITGGK